jgi:hypothetical protein
MDIQIDAKDLDGTDPTPKYIQKAQINFGSVFSSSSSDVELKQRMGNFGTEVRVYDG